ncbi:MAG TPA: aminoglycoside phosphotransferase family protein, partial [Propionibacteriaceae bacterium]|nr:aminoglycoside phosphotransferase family protein [Propionibacteriaceae bacterium]
MTVSGDPDGSTLLTSAEVKDLLSAAVEHAGGSLISWRLDHVDANPRHSTTATYSAAVDWPMGRRTELLGASARVGGRSGNDERAVIFGDGEREVAVWLYPHDPDLPGLSRAAAPDSLAALFNEHRVFDHPVAVENIALEMISYRPRRRAVLKAVVTTSSGPKTFFVKVLRESSYAPTLQRHE